MSKIAFIFPGQGSQYVKMGKEICENYEIAREVFQNADQILGRSLSSLCFNGPEEQLRDTRNSQPGILTTSIALFRVLKAEGIQPDFVAGHSLGEYSALIAAEALSFADALRLVNRRAQLMAEADPDHQGTMAAVLGLDRDTLAGCLKIVSRVEAANFNCPGQIVVSGVKEGITGLSELVSQKGGRLIPLQVSGAFHSSFMKQAAEMLQNDLVAVSWKEPNIPLVSNVSALPASRNELADNLYRQIYSPVLWEDTLRFLESQDVRIFCEVGPGKVLAGLAKKTLNNATIVNCEDSSSLKKALAILKEV